MNKAIVLILALVALCCLHTFTPAAEQSAVLACVAILGASVVQIYRFTAGSASFAHPLQLLIPIVMIEYVLAPAALTWFDYSTAEWVGRIGSGSIEPALANAMLTSAIGLLSLLVGDAIAGNAHMVQPLWSGDAENMSDRFTLPCFVFLLGPLFASVLILDQILFYGEASASENFANRLVLGAGNGVIEVLALFGYAGVILAAIQSLEKKGTVLAFSVLIPATVAAVPFVLVGQRGGAIYPFAMMILVRCAARPCGKLVIWCLPLAGVPILFLEGISQSIRVSLVNGQDFLSCVECQGFAVIPKTFGHLELLAGTCDASGAGVDFPDTSLASLTNWIPREWFPEKGRTTGPVLASFFEPTWKNGDGFQTSSYTTGPILDLWYCGGIPLVVLGCLALGYVSGWLSRWFLSRKHDPWVFMVFVYESYLIGWKLWLDDLGGWINKQLTVLLIAAMCLALSRGMRSGKGRMVL